MNAYETMLEFAKLNGCDISEIKSGLVFYDGYDFAFKLGDKQFFLTEINGNYQITKKKERIHK